MTTDVEPTLAELAYEKVEELIVTLALSPGTIFSESELSREIGIGRTPLREALLKLTSDGLVSSMPRRGMMVSRIDLVEVLNVIETRKALDRIIVGCVARKASTQQRADIASALQALIDTPGAATPQRFLQADYRLDAAIWRAAPNRFAVDACRPLHSHCRRLWYRYHDSDDLKRSSDLHTLVVEAILAGETLPPKIAATN